MGPRRRKWRRTAVKAALVALGLTVLGLMGSGDGEELLAAAMAVWVEGRGDLGVGEAWGGDLINGERGNGAGFMNEGAGFLNGERGNGAGFLNGERGNGAGFLNGERGNGAGFMNGGAGFMNEGKAGGKWGSGVRNGSRGVTNGGRGVGTGAPEDGIWGPIGGPEDGIGDPRVPPGCLGLLSGGSGDLSSLSPRDARTPAVLLAPAPCALPTPPFLLTLVPSAPAHRERRLAVRDTWGGSRGRSGSPRGRTVFVLGAPATARGQRELLRESRQHGDILQGDFADTYANLTRKTLLLLRWARACCAGARFLLKADDDVFVDAPAVATYLATWPAAPQRLYLGRVHWAVAPNRDPRSRHHVPAGVFAGSRFPPYCSGTAYVLSRQAAAAVLGAGRAVPLALPEDVWVGLGARGAGVAPRHWARLGGALRVPAGARCCLGAALVSAHGVRPAELRRRWAGLEREGAGPGRCPRVLRGALGRLRCRALAWGEGLWGVTS